VQRTQMPPMGWNSWDCYGKYPTEKNILNNLNVMKQKLKPFGYTYLVIDAGWNIEKDSANNLSGVSIDAFGRYIPFKKDFPHGLKYIADKAHNAGLLFGIHIMRGIPREAYDKNLPVYGTTYHARDIADTTSLCKWNHDNYGIDMNKPGAQEYYNSYINLLASWGVDYIKADDITAHPQEINAVEKAIDKTGRKIVLSLSPGGDSKTEFIDDYKTATLLRITGDVWDNEKSINKVFDAWKNWNAYANEGLWLDMDMIPFGHICINNHVNDYLQTDSSEGNKGSKGKERMCAFTKNEKYTFITQRALGASPLFMGGDLSTTDTFSFQLLTNKEMLACNKNGVTGRLVYSDDNLEIWKTVNKTDSSKGWIGIFNRSNNDNKTSFTLQQLQLSPCGLFDIWNAGSLGKISNAINVTVPQKGVLFYKYDETVKQNSIL